MESAAETTKRLQAEIDRISEKHRQRRRQIREALRESTTDAQTHVDGPDGLETGFEQSDVTEASTGAEGMQ